MSSGGSKLALVVAGGFAIGTVFYVHMSQNSDRKVRGVSLMGVVLIFF